MLLKVRDAQWKLIGKRRVSIETGDAGLNVGDTVRLGNGGRFTAAVVDSIVKNGSSTVCLDRDLRDDIGVEIGQGIGVEHLSGVPDAKKVQVSVGGGTSWPADTLRLILQGSVMYEGNRGRHISGGDDVLFVIRKTDPPGPVRIAGSTLVEISQAPPEAMGRMLPAQDFGGPGIGMMAERPAERFGDVGGLDDVKRLLTENVIFAMQKDKAKLFENMGYRPVRGVILYGPPGTGKTLLARATAGEAGASFISVPGSEFKNKWYGESERLIRDAFQAARDAMPCIIFIDEIDAIAYARSGDHLVNVVNQLLVILDEVRDLDVFVIGATNVLPMIDPALLRPGRMQPIEVPAPDRAARERIFLIHLKGLDVSRKDMGRLLQLTEGYTGARIEQACNRARMLAMRESGFAEGTRLEMRHILASLDDPAGKSQHLSEYV